MSPSFAVRQLQQRDTFLTRYRDLRIQLWPDCTNDCDREIAEILARPTRWAVFVALLEDQPLGFLEVSLRDVAEGAISSPVAYIEGWFIVPEYRRQGIGKALAKAAENWAVSRGCNEIASDAQIDNAVSIAAYKQLGYREMERLVCFLKQLEPRPLPQHGK